MKRVRISTPARLHVGLVDMNGERGRIDGGVGLALEMLEVFLETPFEGGRHQKRLDQID